ncbi:MAG: zinc ribbon domain-containing protein [Blastocatellia bacterium]|nr:zinc ribbon domain-containing protein [Blastocatellia bacterium]
MFCPRCGTQNPEATKFCRQCGLGLASLTGYVATGGTGALTVPPPAAPPVPVQLPETSEMIALRQKRALTILASIFLPMICTILAEETANQGDVFSVSFLLIPFGITWAIYQYKAQLRRLQEEQLRQYYGGAPQAAYPPPVPAPAFQAPPAQPQLAPPPTNRFNVAAPGRGSVIEDETRQLPIERQ